MSKLQPVIKWTGSKRLQAEQIIKHFPKEINVYYEPFVGGASILYKLLHSDIKVDNYICCDANSDLISLWNTIKDTPEDLIDSYLEMWHEMKTIEDIDKKKEYYYGVRKRFNEHRDVSDFLFLSRTCANGLIRYNKKGEFNSPLHNYRDGIKPETLTKIILDWSNKLNENDVQFLCQDYKSVVTKENDFLYLDPPYVNIKGVYSGGIELDQFWDWLRSQEGKYVLSFDGLSGNKDYTYKVPIDTYSKHIYMESDISGFMKLHQRQEYVKESLYIK